MSKNDQELLQKGSTIELLMQPPENNVLGFVLRTVVGKAPTRKIVTITKQPDETRATSATIQESRPGRNMFGIRIRDRLAKGVPQPLDMTTAMEILREKATDASVEAAAALAVLSTMQEANTTQPANTPNAGS